MWFEQHAIFVVAFCHLVEYYYCKAVEASNVINDPKCNKGPKCNNVWP